MDRLSERIFDIFLTPSQQEVFWQVCDVPGHRDPRSSIFASRKVPHVGRPHPEMEVAITWPYHDVEGSGITPKFWGQGSNSQFGSRSHPRTSPKPRAMNMAERTSQTVLRLHMSGPPTSTTPPTNCHRENLRAADICVTESGPNIRSFMHSSSQIAGARKLLGGEAQIFIDLIDQVSGPELVVVLDESDSA